MKKEKVKFNIIYFLNDLLCISHLIMIYKKIDLIARFTEYNANINIYVYIAIITFINFSIRISKKLKRKV